MGKLRLFLTFLTIDIFLVGCAVTEYKKIDNTIVYEKYKIQFKELHRNWVELDSGRFNIHCFGNRKYGSTIWIKADRLKKGLTITLEESANRWINAMAEKYGWRNVEKVADGRARIDGEGSYWQEFNLVSRGADCNEKIYRVYLNQFLYQFRLRSKTGHFDDAVKEFEWWVKTIKFLR